MSFGKIAAVAGIALTLATCAYAHYAEQGYRIKKLEEKLQLQEKSPVTKTSMLEHAWKSTTPEQRAGLFLGGLESTVQVGVKDARKKVGRMYQGVKYDLKDLSEGDEDGE